MIRKSEEFIEERRQIGGGNGALLLRHMYTKEEMYSRARICAEIIIEPGQSIGLHKHENEFEIYYMISGELVSISEDGTEEAFCAGDSMLTGGGASTNLIKVPCFWLLWFCSGSKIQKL